MILRSLTIRCSCRARLLGSDEVTWAAPEVPSSHRSAVRNRAVLRQPPLPTTSRPIGVQNPCPKSTSHNPPCQRVLRRPRPRPLRSCRRAVAKARPGRAGRKQPVGARRLLSGPFGAARVVFHSLLGRAPRPRPASLGRASAASWSPPTCDSSPPGRHSGASGPGSSRPDLRRWSAASEFAGDRDRTPHGRPDRPGG